MDIVRVECTGPVAEWREQRRRRWLTKIARNEEAIAAYADDDDDDGDGGDIEPQQHQNKRQRVDRVAAATTPQAPASLWGKLYKQQREHENTLIYHAIKHLSKH